MEFDTEFAEYVMQGNCAVDYQEYTNENISLEPLTKVGLQFSP